MGKNELTTSLKDSCRFDIAEFAGNTIESVVDSFIEDGIIKDIPFVGTAFKLYSIGSKIYEEHCLRKLCAFIIEINKGNCSEEVQEKRRRKFVEDEVSRERELKHLLVLIDRYIALEKPQMLAKIYLAYLDNKISWTELTQYAEVVDRFLPGDEKFLLQEKVCDRTISVPIPDAFLRLAALGIYEEYTPDISVPTAVGSTTIPARREKTYKTTAFGKKLQDILDDTNMQASQILND